VKNDSRSFAGHYPDPTIGKTMKSTVGRRVRKVTVAYQYTNLQVGYDTLPNFRRIHRIESKFNEPRQNVGGIATVTTGSSCVESDYPYSPINWTKDPSSRSLMDYSLEAILHYKQYGKSFKKFFDPKKK
jgi:hypothetical protein